ncbi:MAG: DUF1996 domain-containing protein [Candidatus Saccharibacteria bacterium]|nr:DUF1996 domain-containing protein [Candidatus Saccharibacteria bacterium]
MKLTFRSTKIKLPKKSRKRDILLVVSFAAIGGLILIITHASTPVISVEPENGVKAPYDLAVADATASGGSAVRFGQKKTTVTWRNSKYSFDTTETGKSSANLDLTKLIIPQVPDFKNFHSNYSSVPPLSLPQGQNGQFRATCEPSHISNDDAIVYPNQPGAAHEHLFYGNTGSNAYSTADSIINSGSSTCAGQEGNRTSYWFPTMLDASGNTRIPNEMYLYYKGEGVSLPPGGFSALPQGIKMLAGNSKTAVPQIHDYNNGFACGDLFSNPTSDIIPAGETPLLRSGDTNPTSREIRSRRCKGGESITSPWTGSVSISNLKQKVLYPRCWNGVGMNPTDVTYPVNGVCPAGSKVFPEISILFVWELAVGETTDGWHLSSDHLHNADGTMTELPGGTTRHGDYIAGWNKKIIESWTNNCINNDWNCQANYITNSTIFDGVNYAATTTNGYPFLKPAPHQGRFATQYPAQPSNPCIVIAGQSTSNCDNK